MNEARYREVEHRLWVSLDVQPAERQVDLGRLGTTVRVQEVGDWPIVLFVHGGSASGANWAPLVARLDGYRCVLLDRPGCGLSAPTSADLTDLDRFGRFASDLVADVLDGLDEPSAHAPYFAGDCAICWSDQTRSSAPPCHRRGPMPPSTT